MMIRVYNSTNDTNMRIKKEKYLFQAIQPFDIIFICFFDVFALQFEGFGEEARIWSPGFVTQDQFFGDFDTVQLA